MNESNLVHGRGTVVAQSVNGRPFVTGPTETYAIDDSLRAHLKPGDKVGYEAVYGDQFATPATVDGRRLP